MAARQFSNVAVETTLSSGIAGGASSLTVVSAAGWPAAPFILVIEPDLANEELIVVGAKAGAVFSSLTRGFGGTSDVGHSAGDEIKHVIVGEDLALTYTHIHKPGTDDTAAVTHADILSPGVDDHHAQSHDLASHTNRFGALRAERITSAQVLSTPGQLDTVIFNSVVDEDDPNGDLTHNVSTGVCTINNTGWYLITSSLEWGSLEVGTTQRIMLVQLLNPGATIAQTRWPVTTPFESSISVLEKIVAAQTVEIQAAWAGSGTDEEISEVGSITHMAIARVR